MGGFSSSATSATRNGSIRALPNAADHPVFRLEQS
jgi:hypothetical protein